MTMEEQTALAMTKMADSFALNQALTGIRTFNGRSPPLKDFIQDIRNGKLFIGEDAAKERIYVKAILTRLVGPARDCTFSKTFNTVEDVVNQLKKRFAPGRDYSYYYSRINNAHMRQKDTVGDFYDYLNLLLTGAENALTNELEVPQAQNKAQAIENAIKPLKMIAKDIFMKGLPPRMASYIDMKNPETLEDAYNEAVRRESKMEAGIIADDRSRYVQYESRNQNRTPNFQPRSYDYRYQDSPRYHEQQHNGQYDHRGFTRSHDYNRINIVRDTSPFDYRMPPNFNGYRSSYPNSNYTPNNSHNNNYNNYRPNNGRSQNLYKDPRLFNPNAPTNQPSSNYHQSNQPPRYYNNYQGNNYNNYQGGNRPYQSNARGQHYSTPNYQVMNRNNYLPQAPRPNEPLNGSGTRQPAELASQHQANANQANQPSTSAQVMTIAELKSKLQQ